MQACEGHGVVLKLHNGCVWTQIKGAMQACGDCHQVLQAPFGRQGGNAAASKLTCTAALLHNSGGDRQGWTGLGSRARLCWVLAVLNWILLDDLTA
jgi:hypothetical protein